MYTSLNDLPPKIYDSDKFECYLTGHLLTEAYLIDRKYLSFYDPVVAVTWVRRQINEINIPLELGQKLLHLIQKDLNNEELFAITAIVEEKLLLPEMFSLDSNHPVNTQLNLHLNETKLKYQKYLMTVKDISSSNSSINTTTKKRKRSESNNNSSSSSSNLYFVPEKEEDTSFYQKTVSENSVIDLSDIFGPGSKMSLHYTRPNNFCMIFSVEKEEGSENNNINSRINSILARFNYTKNIIHRGNSMILSKNPLF